MTYWPEDPYGDMAPLLRASVEAAKARHPSGKMQGATVAVEPIIDEAFPQYRTPGDAVLTKADRCDNCIGEAVYRVQSSATATVLDFCLHHWRKHFPAMSAQGWGVIGANPELAAAIGGEGS